MKTNKLHNFKFFENIIQYDGPFLSLGITENDEPVLVVWMDEEKGHYVFADIYIQNDDLNLFLNNKKSYFNIIKDSEKIIVWKHNTDNNSYEFNDMNIDNFLYNYGPEEKADLSDFLIDIKNLYTNFNIES